MDTVRRREQAGLVAAAADRHPQTQWLVTAPFGLHPQMQEIINDRIRS